jgi:hypothetical protein
MTNQSDKDFWKDKLFPEGIAVGLLVLSSSFSSIFIAKHGNYLQAAAWLLNGIASLMSFFWAIKKKRRSLAYVIIWVSFGVFLLIGLIDPNALR